LFSVRLRTLIFVDSAGNSQKISGTVIRELSNTMHRQSGNLSIYFWLLVAAGFAIAGSYGITSCMLGYLCR